MLIELQEVRVTYLLEHRIITDSYEIRTIVTMGTQVSELGNTGVKQVKTTADFNILVTVSKRIDNIRNTSIFTDNLTKAIGNT